MNGWESLPLRFGLGSIFLYHGLQRAFGYFGGSGLEEFAELIAEIGFSPAMTWAYIGAYTALVGGICLIVGLFTRLSAMVLFVLIMVVAAKIHMPNGFFLANGGYEYDFIIACACLSLAILGPGRMCISEKF